MTEKPLTLEQLRFLLVDQDMIWLEIKGDIDLYYLPVHGDPDGLGDIPVDFWFSIPGDEICYTADTYGKTWRCWEDWNEPYYREKVKWDVC